MITGSAGGTNYFTIQHRPGDGRGDVHASTATTSGTRAPASDDDTADADAGERRPAAAGADGDRCRRRHRHGGDQSGQRRVHRSRTTVRMRLWPMRLRRRLCWTRRGRWDARRTATAAGGSCDGDGELCAQLCGGNRLRQRRCLAALTYSLVLTGVERGVRAVCAGRGGHHRGRRRRHRPGRGDRAQPGRQRDHRLGGRDRTTSRSGRPGDGRGDVHASSANIWHANTAATTTPQTLTLANASALPLVQTVTDADGDSDTAAIDLGTGVFQIEDDGPDAVVANAAAAAIVLDETRPVGTETDGDSAPAGLETVTVNFARQLCGGNRLRQRRAGQR